MLIACWSPKGGSGTTVVSAALAILLARGDGAVVADLTGDVPTVLGAPAPPEGLGLADWLSADADVPADALSRIEVQVCEGLGLLPWSGAGRPSPATAQPAEALAGEALAVALALDPRSVVVDCGRLDGQAQLAVASRAGQSLMVLRACYLGLRRALDAPLRPSGVVLLAEPGRALVRADVEDALAVPVRAEIVVDPAVARAVDAGLLMSRIPRGLERSLRPAVAA